MRWAGHVVCIGEMRNAYKILLQKPRGRDYFEDLRGWVVLKWILKKEGVTI